MSVEMIHGTAVLHLSEQGAPLSSAQDAVDVIGSTWGTGAEVVAVPVGRLDPAFFDLRSGVAGELAQKFVNYQLRLAVVGDISEQVSASDALRDLVRESNRGRHLWFVAGPDELAQRLAPAAS
jgi:hypothetical protein